VESRVGAMKIVLSTPQRTALAAACILFVLMLGMMPCQAAFTGNAIKDIKDFHSNFIHHQEKSPVGQLELPEDTVYFPWHGRDEIGAKCPSCSAVPSKRPVKEDIRMKGSESKEKVQDLKAMNSVRQRDVVYEEVQEGEADPQGLSNSMDIQVFGGAEGDHDGEEYGSFGDSIESLVNSRLTASMNGADSRDLASSRGGSLGNNMNIEVSGISVSAINTVEGGSAVANSNIVIKPVQIITAPAEVDEKLK
jgi:hypothetical protein